MAPKLTQAQLNSNLVTYAWYGSVNGVKEAIKMGADVNHKNSWGQTPARMTVKSAPDGKVEKIECLKCLDEHGADLFDVDRFGASLLHTAAEFGGNVECIRYLCEKGIMIDCKDMAGVTPVYRAFQNGNLDALEYFIGHGADMKIIDIEKRPTGQVDSAIADKMRSLLVVKKEYDQLAIAIVDSDTKETTIGF